MSGISPEQADMLAVALNQMCGATIQALRGGDMRQCLAVATSLRDFRAQFDDESEVSGFVKLLEQWLTGQRPTEAAVTQLDAPFSDALVAMLQEIPFDKLRAPPASATPSGTTSRRTLGGQAASQGSPIVGAASQEPPPISRRVLTQLISAVIVTAGSNNKQIQGKLATQLVNIQSALEGPWRERIAPLLENLRYVLGGADAHLLPAVPDPEYQKLWQNTIQVMSNSQVDEESAHQQLLDRLVHNTRFTLQARKPELTAGFLQVLEDVQHQALSTDSPSIVTLVAAIRAYLKGLDPTPFTLLLEGQELEAWQKIIAG
ncbi:MAG: hypothetical protein ACPGWR_10080 [Ardenticatenaceae bacterium]